MSFAQAVVAAATYPARMALAVSRLLLQLGHLSSPEGPILRRGGYAERLERVLENDGHLENLLGPGGTLDQLVALGATLEEIRPRLTELAEVIPSLHEAVDDLARSAVPLAELANRLPRSRRRATGPVLAPHRAG